MRKDTPSRIEFNSMVWERTFLISKKFRFNHEIVMDGIPASLLYSRRRNANVSSLSRGQLMPPVAAENMNYIWNGCGSGPRKVMMVTEDGISLHQTKKLWKRLEKIQGGAREREKAAWNPWGGNQAVVALQSEKFACYLKAKRVADHKLQSFYHQHKWRAWKFRINCEHKGSQYYWPQTAIFLPSTQV